MKIEFTKIMDGYYNVKIPNMKPGDLLKIGKDDNGIFYAVIMPEELRNTCIAEKGCKALAACQQRNEYLQTGESPNAAPCKATEGSGDAPGGTS